MNISAFIVLAFFAAGGVLIISSLSGEKEKYVKMGGAYKPDTTDYLGQEAEKMKEKEGIYGFLNALGIFNLLWLSSATKIRDYSQKMLDKADLHLRPEGLWFAKELLAALAVAAVILLELPLPALIGGLLFAVVFPDMIVKGKIKQREFLILRTFPEIIDLMGLCLSAGLDFMSSLRWLTEGRFVFDNPFIKDLKRLKEEIALGRSRNDALKGLSARLDLIDVTSLVRTLIIAETMGVSVGESFERFSADMRDRRFHRGERQARVASILILFPLIFFIMPVVGIIIMGPIVLKFSQGGLMGGMM